MECNHIIGFVRDSTALIESFGNVTKDELIRYIDYKSEMRRKCTKMTEEEIFAAATDILYGTARYVFRRYNYCPLCGSGIHWLRIVDEWTEAHGETEGE